MRRRHFIFGAVVGGAMSSLPRVLKRKGIYLSDFGYTDGADNTEALILAEATAFMKNQRLIFPKNGKIKLSRPIIFRVSVDGNNAKLEALNSSVFIRIKNAGPTEQVVRDIVYNGNKTSNGFFIDETSNILVKNCEIRDCLDVGISIFESDSIQLVHNSIEGSPQLIIDTVKSKNIFNDGAAIKGQA